jgi:hypothetical protein
MRRLVIVGFLIIAAVTGCASMKATSTSAGSDVAHGAAPPVSRPPSISPPPPAASPSQPDPANKGSDQGSAATPPPASTATGSSQPKAKSSADTRPVKPAGAAAAHTRPAAPSSPAPTAAPAPITSPTLNLADLKQRLRETRAIGIFTKLSLKNEVDDLLNAFRALYRGPNKHPPVDLRQRYDQLLLKVLTLLQDGDPPLAAAIASSREAIWSILADPDKFAQI